jgi:hypothetical protein
VEGKVKWGGEFTAEMGEKWAVVVKLARNLKWRGVRNGKWWGKWAGKLKWKWVRNREWQLGVEFRARVRNGE